MSRILAFIIDIFKFHKLKLLLFFISFFLFFVILFPYKEMNLLLQSKINEAIKPHFVEIEEVEVSFLPSLSFKLKALSVNVSKKVISLDSVELRPSILSFFTLKPSLEIYFHNLFKGVQKIHLKYLNQQNYEFEGIFNLEFSEALKAFNQPEFLLGDVKGVFKGVFEPQTSSFKESSLKIALNKTSQGLTLRGSQLINHLFQGFDFPSLIFSEVDLFLNVNSPKMILQDLKLGNPTDAVFIRAKGDMNLDLKTSQLGPYKTKWLMKVKPDKARSLFFLEFLNAYKTSSSKELSYQFELAGKNLKAPPSLKALSQF